MIVNMAKEVRIVSVAQVVGKTRLVGSAMGRADHPLFVSELHRYESGILCFNWSGVDLATGSYLKAAYLPVFQSTNGLPILTSGLNSETHEELEFALQSETRPLLILDSKKRGKAFSVSFLGILDEAYERTLLALNRHESASAAELYQESFGQSPQIGKTAWINRLNRLFEMGLITRTKAGKGYRYSNIAV
jgi:hypothetical protein